MNYGPHRKTFKGDKNRIKDNYYWLDEKNNSYSLRFWNGKILINNKKISNYKKEWREKNKDRLQENKKEYRKNNREMLAKMEKDWYEKNKEHVAKRGKEYRERNKEKCRERSKKYREKIEIHY